MPSDRAHAPLPTFIVIGAAKGGTTSLADYLGSHTDVFVTTPKEPKFFSSGWHKGLGWYERLFAGAGDAIARGEASTNYSVAALFPEVPERIASLVPDVKLVYSIRDPVERIRSHYRMNIEFYRERRPLRDVVYADPAYFEASRYGRQLDRYLDAFDREQILVISAEQLRANRTKTLVRVLSFIGVDPTAVPSIDRELNRGVDVRRPGPVVEAGAAVLRRTGALQLLSKRTKVRLRRRLGHPVEVDIPPDVEAEIWERLEPDLVRLREVVGPDFDLWGRA